MRRLNEVEKRFAQYIITKDNRGPRVYEVLEKELKEEKEGKRWEGYQIGLHSRTVEVLSESNSITDFPTIADLLAYFVKLIQLLEEQGYIYLHTPHDLRQEKKDSEGKVIGNTSTKLFDSNSTAVFVSDQIEKELADTFLKEITITEEFRQYAENDFRTREDIRYKKQLCMTRVAIVFSFIFGTAGLWINISRPNFSSSVHPITNNKIQQIDALDSINANMVRLYKSLSAQADSLQSVLDTQTTKSDEMILHSPGQ